jgi:Fe-S-cluster-containing dehydrogenase component
VLISPKMAEQLKVQSKDMLKIELNGKSLDLPVWIQAGHPENSVTVYLGYGRRRAGRVGTETGFDVYPLRYSATPWIASGKVSKTSGTYILASTQGYQTMDAGTDNRAIVKTANLEEYKKEADFDGERPQDNETLYNETLRQEYAQKEPFAWGMTIDLNKCVGCNNCIIACQAENNIPVVGKDQVNRGRHMHWLRVDTYYQGDRQNPKAHFQPVPCMQCETAPCELVCPVGATTHSTEGLNDMIYNRCVGTRYCSNNCPYKVRRFNFFLFQDWETSQFKMMRNPDVTVRSRGVMEKCTYCVQRITHHRIDWERAATEQEKKTAIDTLETACQQSCPANAIVFGNISDPGTAVSKWKATSRNYGLLDDLNTRPRTTYLAEIRNPNPELEKSS